MNNPKVRLRLILLLNPFHRFLPPDIGGFPPPRVGGFVVLGALGATSTVPPPSLDPGARLRMGDDLLGRPLRGVEAGEG